MLTKLSEILLSSKPSKEIEQNHDYLFNLIPELKKTVGFNQNNPWHIYDVYEHTLHVIDNTPRNLILRLTALFHDLGKIYTYTIDENNIGHFYLHWEKSQEIFLNFSKKINLDKNMTKKISKLIFYHDIQISKLTKKECQNLILELGSENIKDLFKIKQSDLLAQNPKYHYLLKDYHIQEKKLLKISKQMQYKLVTPKINNQNLLIKNDLYNMFHYAHNIPLEEKNKVIRYVHKRVKIKLNNYKLIKQKNKIIGSLLLENENDSLLLSELYIIPKYRNKKIGTKIILDLIENNNTLTLWVYKDNKIAFNLYTKLGFKIIEEKETRYHLKYSH